MTESKGEIEIYWNLMSQPGRAVKTLIDIGKIKCKLIEVDLMQREQKQQWYQSINPLGKVPSLKHGDFHIGESGAIMIYLCEIYQNLKPLYGQTPKQRAVINQYMSWYQNYFRPALFKPVRAYLGAVFTQKPILERHKKLFDREIKEAMQLLDKILAINKTKFIAGDSLSLADLLLFYEVTNLELYGISRDLYPNVKNWFAQVYRVPEVTAVTHEWFKNSKDTIQMIANVPIVKEEPKPKL